MLLIANCNHCSSLLHWITAEVVERLKCSEGCTDSNEDLPKAYGIRNKLWLLFEHPESSRPAFVIGIISIITNIRVLRAPVPVGNVSSLFLVFISSVISDLIYAFVSNFMLCFDTAIISVIMTLVCTIFPLSIHISFCPQYLVLHSPSSFIYYIFCSFFSFVFLFCISANFWPIFRVHSVDLSFSGSRFVLNVSVLDVSTFFVTIYHPSVPTSG